MAVTRKPKPQVDSPVSPLVDVEALINKGGSVPQVRADGSNGDGGGGGSDVSGSATPGLENSGSATAVMGVELRSTATVNLRIPVQWVERIDSSVEKRRVRTPRHTWLLEAILEKLEREGAE